MQNVIHNIRNQPERTKRHILHATVLFCGFILALLWVYSLGTNFSNPETQAKLGDDLKPISALKANLIDGYYSITGPSGSSQSQQ